MDYDGLLVNEAEVEQPDQHELFLHNQISIFQQEFERFIMSDDSRLLISHDHKSKNHYVHVVYYYLRQGFNLQFSKDKETITTIDIVPGELPVKNIRFRNSLLYTMLNKSIPLKCTIYRIPQNQETYAGKTLDTVKIVFRKI